MDLELIKMLSKDLGYDPSGRDEVMSFISTGSPLLDIAISNRIDGGVPVGRLTEIVGLESAGKSVVMAQLIANAQKMGMKCVLIDTETTSDKYFLTKFGVNYEDMTRVVLENVEDVVNCIELIIKKYQEESDGDDVVETVKGKKGKISSSKRKRKLFIGWDSVASTPSKEEVENDIEKQSMGVIPRILSKGLRKINKLVNDTNTTLVFTNQLKENIGQMFGDKMVAPGGHAIKFHASARIRLNRKSEIKNAQEQVIGIKVRAKVIKNKVAIPYREADFDIYFNKGISDYDYWLDILGKEKLVELGAWNKITIPGQEKKQFRRADWPTMCQSKEFGPYIKEQIEKLLILDDNAPINTDAIEPEEDPSTDGDE